ncbi:MAG TPA: hypothetical protein VNX68_14410 [Nitrosopumilaceae archaeon]|jgi:hypothetical protein|nr:hypothetical protein [Nitrosopumilaceae archaeon]
MEELEVQISGIKCDVPHCNYRDDDVKFVDYPEYINKRCPACGANLLTQECYDKTVRIYKITNRLNKFLKFINKFNPIRWFKKPTVTALNIHYENDGTKTKTITKEK